MTGCWRQKSESLLRLLQSAGPEDLTAAAEDARALLEEMRMDPSFHISPAELETIHRLRRLAASASNLYQGWLTITAARTAGYDGCGAPAPLEMSSVRVEG